MKTYRGNEGIGPRILDFGSKRKLVVGQFHDKAALTPGKDPTRPQCPFDKRMSGTQRVWKRWRNENHAFPAPSGNRTRSPNP
jgi:hypothetical protein